MSCCRCININQAMGTIWWTTEGHSVIMWFAVYWSPLQSQAGLLDRPHLHISALKRPTSVRSLLSLTQACRGRSDPGQHLDGETIYSHSLLVDRCHSADYILAIQWAFVSLGRVVDRRSSLLVAKGCRDFSLDWSLPWWWCGGGGDLDPWHGGPEPDLLLAYEALLVGCLQAQGAALLVSVVSIQWLYVGCS